MYVISVTIKPAAGKVGALRDLLTDWVKYRKNTGATVGLAEDIWPTHGPAFRINSIYETMADAEEGRQTVLKDAKTRSVLSEGAQLMSGPGEWRILEGINTPSATDGKIALTVTLRPALGKIAELQQVLNGWVDYARGKGASIGMVQEIWGANGAAFTVRTNYKSIAEAESKRKELLGDPRYGDLVKTLAPLLAGPASWGIREVLVPSRA